MDNEDDIDTDPGMGPAYRLDLSDLDVEQLINEWDDGLKDMGWGVDESLPAIPPVSTKPLTQREMRKKDGTCPDCGHRGEWTNMALVCPQHGKFMG